MDMSNGQEELVWFLWQHLFFSAYGLNVFAGIYKITKQMDTNVNFSILDFYALSTLMIIW